ncbi:type II toxin-antitoxin system VapC family toxin [Agrobacterium sp. a22-2]|uniref:type II toxin-antitoxin system VapC family toxin n=1 Tax=Agrobacterium sp. a22-2 TaxID=2283840 RepID=UPI001445EFAE|nr:type II toxin-antitoxin system VapC family toxin [Agrobacterium sp. a22-2]NKN37683.1 type II toxin-antitoxin system VapC family toxin [Agrobacterium sp. a22-2]
MSFLIDTHAFLWWVLADPNLSSKAKAAIDDADAVRYVSSVTPFEIANKLRIGKLEFAREIVENYDTVLHEANFLTLDITSSHALLAGRLAGEHKDPFDRLLAAQASLDALVLISADRAFDGFDIDRLW